MRGPRNRRRGWLAGLVCLLLSGLAAAGVGAGQPAVWLRIDTAALELHVMRGGERLRTYSGIAIGRYGTTAAKRVGDGMTPLGEFRIVRIAARTDFHRFYGLDYPNLSHARAGLQAGRITATQFERIRQALRQETEPPQHTALGGYIGIHGLGDGDSAIHADFNWTEGCIALTNEQVDDLAQWIDKGTRVVIE
ncbi:L,D-transpeptidase family protein [Thiohalobacter thiocyanaticus]|uniref:Murein L,D-transpeptidase n=1 Tax=Thiohalobacter thiocyanaticus TaxID=585455 RepID=A0A426QFX6_9GAMM|nr:L,D-transpeptidase [Thiohalobacter thiocyanaticus]RRQ20651.1 murein L,D-transpeptidase [Thiohalobacter thiocyanaticus]